MWVKFIKESERFSFKQDLIIEKTGKDIVDESQTQLQLINTGIIVLIVVFYPNNRE